MQVEFVAVSPAARRFAELAIEFVSNVLSADSRARLRYIVVVEMPQSIDELRDRLSIACDIIEVDKFTCEMMAIDTSEWVSSGNWRIASYGMYVYDHNQQRAVIWILRPAEHLSYADSFTLYHELGHFIITSTGNQISVAEALNDDTGFYQLLDTIKSLAKQPLSEDAKKILAEIIGSERNVERLREKEADKLISSVVVASLSFGMCAHELAATTIGANYFLLLNTKPYTYPNRFALLPPPINFAHTSCNDMISKLRTDLLSLKTFDTLSYAVRLTKYSRTWFYAVGDEKVVGELPRFSQVVHKAFVSATEAMPKHVYLSNPDRYAPLFRGIDWDFIKSLEIPVMQ
jgi:hypothetical protein